MIVPFSCKISIFWDQSNKKIYSIIQEKKHIESIKKIILLNLKLVKKLVNSVLKKYI